MKTIQHFEIKNGKWTEANFDPNKRQVTLYKQSHFFNSEGQRIMIEKGIGQF